MYLSLQNCDVEIWNELKRANSEAVFIKEYCFQGSSSVTSMYGDFDIDFLEWEEVDFDDVIFENCKFELIKFVRASFKNSTFKNCTFLGCEFHEVIVDNTSISGSSFDKYHESVAFEHCKIFSLDFSKCNLFNVVGVFTTLIDVRIGADFPFKTLKGEVYSMTDSFIENINISDFKLSRIELNKCEVKESRFTNCDIGAILFGSVFSKVELIGCNLMLKKPSYIDILSRFEYSSLINTNISNTDLVIRSYKNENDYSAFKFSNVDFSGSTFLRFLTRGSFFESCSFERVDFKYAFFLDSRFIKPRHLSSTTSSGGNEMDYFTLSHSDPLPGKFLNFFHFGTDIIDKFSFESNTITINFKERFWPQLFPIELLLANKIEDRFKVEKTKEEITIYFYSNDDLQLALDVVIPVVMSFENRLPGKIENLSIIPENEILESIDSKNLNQLVVFLLARLEAEFPIDTKEVGPAEKSVVEAVKSVPVVGGVISVWIERWFGKKKKSVSESRQNILDAYNRLNAFFDEAKKIADSESGIKGIEE